MRNTLITLLATASSVSAHALMYGVWVNGEDQGDGRNEYIRSPPNNSPVKDLSSADIVCNVHGGTPAPSFVSAAAGDTLSFEWLHDNRNDDIIDGSHKGPLITYIAEYTEGDATGALWTKIAEDGYDGSEWAVDKIKANSGLQDFVLPAGLAPGQYLIRQEIIAHHESETTFDVNPARGAQFYPSCVQVEVTSGGSSVPDQAFDFQVDYTYADPGINFNLYGSFSSYPIPGPEVWTGEGGSTTPTPEEPEEPAPEEPTPTSAPSVPTATAAPTPTSGFATVTTTSAASVPTSPPTEEQPAPECPARRRKRSSKNKRSKKTVRRSRL